LFQTRDFGHGTPSRVAKCDTNKRYTSATTVDVARCFLTLTDDRRMLITLGVQLCVQGDRRLGVRQRRAVYRR